MDEGPAVEQRFIEAATWFAAMLDTIPDAAWDRPGLGEWDLRALVGHTSRALVTVSRALTHPASEVAIRTAADYILQTASIQASGARTAEGTTVTERGIAAGQDLGPHPAAAVRELLDTTATALTTVMRGSGVTEHDPIVTTIGGGMVLGAYLRTRVFELVVHGLDVQHAIAEIGSRASVPPQPPPHLALADALDLAQQVALARGSGAGILLALTGRSSLPGHSSVLAPSQLRGDG